MENQSNEKGEVEGFSLSGEEVRALKDKTFVICGMPHYEEMEDLDNKDKKKRKLIVPVKLADGVETDWLANKTSQRVIIAAKGRMLSQWVGYAGEFVVKDQLVGKDEKKVIYLK